MLTLMKSIAEDGLTTMPIIAMSVSGKLVVMDGNRRITALKLLNDPDVCPVPHLKQKIKALRARNPAGIPAKIDVLVSEDETAIAKEVLARHAGAAGGAGQLDWSAYLRTVYELNHGHPAKYKRPGQYALWAEQQGIDVEDEFPITSLERFFTRENLLQLGFRIRRDEIEPCIALPSAKALAMRLMRDFSSGKVNVDSVRTPEKAAAYLGLIRADLGLTELPPPSEPTPNEAAHVDAPAGGALLKGDGSKAAAGLAVGNRGEPVEDDEQEVNLGAPAAKKRSPLQHPAERVKLFPSRSPDIPVPAAEVKAASIVAELRSMKLRGPGATPVAAAFLLRGLVEIGNESYRERNQLRSKCVLAKSVRATAEHMHQNGRLTDDEFDVVRRCADESDGLLSIEHLQRWLHRSTHIPAAHRLVAFWDDFGSFVRACWGS